jgi:hypothetical protein
MFDIPDMPGSSDLPLVHQMLLAFQCMFSAIAFMSSIGSLQMPPTLPWDCVGWHTKPDPSKKKAPKNWFVTPGHAGSHDVFIYPISTVRYANNGFEYYEIYIQSLTTLFTNERNRHQPPFIECKNTKIMHYTCNTVFVRASHPGL